MRYTAIGVYEDNMQPWAESFEADNHDHAKEVVLQHAPAAVTLFFLLDGEPAGSIFAPWEGKLVISHCTDAEGFRTPIA